MNAIKIWHDNSGNDSSWYLKHVIIHDLQTREKFYFICEKWLAIDKEDAQLERILHLSLDLEKSRFKYLLTRRIKEKLTDDHLWFSIVSRPVQSSFNRLDRLTCCFVLLSISMLINILYYEVDRSSSQNSFKIGPFLNLTLEQISVGVFTNMFVLLPSLLLVQLFRRTKRKTPRFLKIKNLLSKNKSEPMRKKKRAFEFKFPWWFKFVVYLISFLVAFISFGFVIIKGIEFGNEKVINWLTSLIISCANDILITQPIKVKKNIQPEEITLLKINILRFS